ncbi:MAG TPA: putative glycoside hydrolase [Bellilinea sp.]|nr:putative glycoside hydrolase [Bellilinea sp.]
MSQTIGARLKVKSYTVRDIAPPPEPLPAAPTGLSATASGTDQVDLAWTDNATNETGFTIERSTDGATWAQIAVTAADAESYSDTGLASNTTYYYRVRAVNASGYSAYSNTDSDTTGVAQIAFIAATSNNASSEVTSIAGSTPPGVVAGNWLLARVAVRKDGNAITPPSGWTQQRSDYYVSSGDDTISTVFARKVVAGEPASHTFNFSVASRAIIEILAFSTVDDTPVDVDGGQYTSSSATCTAPSITTTTPGAMLVFFGTAAGGATTFTPPAGMTEATDVQGSGVSPSVSGASAYVIQAAAGASGSKAATLSGAANNIGQLLALRPGGSGSTPPPAASGQVPLSYFYVVPASQSAAQLGADNYSTLILDHKSDRLTFLAAMRAAGFAGLALHYLVFDYVQSPSASFYPRASFINYKSTDWATIDANESWFLHSGTPATSANRVPGSSTGEWYMDPGSAGWQAWVVARLQEMEAGGWFGFDGVFWDNVQLSWNKPKAKAGANLYDGSGTLIATSAAYRTRCISFLTAVRAGITGEHWGNMIEGANDGSDWDAYMAYMDGGMKEDLTGWQGTDYHGATTQANILTQLATTLAAGKGIVAVAQGDSTDTGKQLYSLAAFLLVVPSGFGPTATPITSFRYADYDEYNYMRLYSNYNLGTLGNPTGARYARTDGQPGWRRDFTGGYVQINTTTHQGQIVLA